MLDGNVRNSLLLINQKAARSPMGQVQVRLTMQNALAASEDLWAEVRFVYYDSDKMPVDTGQWQSVYFPPKELVLIEGNSLRSDVSTFNVQLRNLKSRTGKRLVYPDGVYEYGDPWHIDHFN